MIDNVLTISGMHKSFGGLQVIDNVSMEVRRGPYRPKRRR